MVETSSQSSLDLVAEPSLSLIVCQVSVGLIRDHDLCVEVDGSPVVWSREDISPVWKKSGKVLSRM